MWYLQIFQWLSHGNRSPYFAVRLVSCLEGKKRSLSKNQRTHFVSIEMQSLPDNWMSRLLVRPISALMEGGVYELWEKTKKYHKALLYHEVHRFAYFFPFHYQVWKLQIL